MWSETVGNGSGSQRDSECVNFKLFLSVCATFNSPPQCFFSPLIRTNSGKIF